jgi:transketolase N-terminal domain/subunit
MFTNPDWAEELIKKYGIHCDRRAGCDANGGSLGHAGGIAIGLALVFKTRDIYIVFSDGSMQEGSNWEALRIMEELKLDNIKCYFNFNGYTALQKADTDLLSKRVYSFCLTGQIRLTKNGRGYEGVKGHYIKAI